jgi:hypothetical protein
VRIGFIKPNYSVWNGLATFFSFNNETTNVLTQFAGLLVFYWCFYCIKVASERGLQEGMLTTTTSSKTSISLRRFWLETVFLSDCLCCTFSLLYHMYRVMNMKWYPIFNFLDWGGCTLVAILSSLAVDMTELSIDTLPAWISPETHGVLTTLGFIGVICLWMSGRTNHATRFISFNVVVFGAADHALLRYSSTLGYLHSPAFAPFSWQDSFLDRTFQRDSFLVCLTSTYRPTPCGMSSTSSACCCATLACATHCLDDGTCYFFLSETQLFLFSLLLFMLF